MVDLEAPVSTQQTKQPQVAQILIVDDDPMNVEVLKAMLYEKNIPSDTVLNGKDAMMLVRERLKLVRANQAPMYKVILLDYSMPDMDGPTVATNIRKLLEDPNDIFAAENQRPYICCCTAYDEAGFK